MQETILFVLWGWGKGVYSSNSHQSLPMGDVVIGRELRFKLKTSPSSLLMVQIPLQLPLSIPSQYRRLCSFWAGLEGDGKDWKGLNPLQVKIPFNPLSIHLSKNSRTKPEMLGSFCSRKYGIKVVHLVFLVYRLGVQGKEVRS